VNYNPNTIKETTVVSIEVPNTEEKFPVLQLDTDSYIVQGEVQSGINFNFSEGVPYLLLTYTFQFANNERLPKN